MTIEILQNFLLAALLAYAAWIDQKQHRIPNWLTGSLLFVGLGIHGITDGVTGLGFALSGMLVGLSIFLILYLLRGMAAGDVKLMAAIGAWVGPAQAVAASCLTLLAGGAAALLVVTYRFYREPAGSIRALVSYRFPYAAVIAVGTAASFILKETPWTT